MLVPQIVLNKPTTPINLALLVIEVDTRASRIQVLDRGTGQLQAHLPIYSPKLFKFLPIEYASRPNLMVIMIDDTNVFNAAIADNVQAQIIDLVTFDPNDLPTAQ
tara:strand:- start:2096 stop:2410 length:315 start_codon:yes stop_codon:yes gene_type:complete